MDLLLTFAGLGDVVGGLHTHERVHFHSKGLLNSQDRKSTRLNSSHQIISYAVFCLKKKKKPNANETRGSRRPSLANGDERVKVNRTANNYLGDSRKRLEHNQPMSNASASRCDRRST